MVAGFPFPHYLDPGAQTIQDAVHLADGRSNSVLNRANGKGQLVERPLDHAIHTPSLDLCSVADIAYQSTKLVRFTAQGSTGGGQVFGNGFELRREVLDDFARRHDHGQGLQTHVVNQGHDLFLGLADTKEHGQREAGLHENADRGYGNEDE